jgi:predicted AAA+ superfamily ATPase
MNLIGRDIEKKIEDQFGKNKVLLLLGTRRVGKTILVREIKSKYKGESLLLNAEDFDVQALLKNRTVANYKKIIGDATLLIIDEAQVIKDIGPILKLMIDSIPGLTIIATGSSSFDLLNKTGDPLTGRQYLFQLFPLAQHEIGKEESFVETAQNLEERLIFGSYPEIFQSASYQEKSGYLEQLVQSYLLKDILAFDAIRNSDKIYKLLRLLAYQMGNEVSNTELGRQLGMSKNTVENYLDLLSKVFIIHRLSAYNSNQRKEISKNSKWYFYDNGIRNAIINDFRLPALRNDIAALWENYLLSERIKKNAYEGNLVQYYFWRNYNGQEVDLIESSDGKINAFEFKYTKDKKSKPPSAFAANYPAAGYTIISRENYLEWIVQKDDF